MFSYKYQKRWICIIISNSIIFTDDIQPLFHLPGCENPKPCQTNLTVLEYGLYDGDPVTKVLLQPLTGKDSYS